MLNKETQRKKRQWRTRKRMIGTSVRPRLAVHRSLNHLYFQVIDDVKSQTLLSGSTLEKDFSKSAKGGTKTNLAQKLGQYSAEKMKKKGIQQIAFDRGGYKYHGRIKALAESLREAGIKF